MVAVYPSLGELLRIWLNIAFSHSYSVLWRLLTSYGFGRVLKEEKYRNTKSPYACCSRIACGVRHTATAQAQSINALANELHAFAQDWFRICLFLSCIEEARKHSTKLVGGNKCTKGFTQPGDLPKVECEEQIWKSQKCLRRLTEILLWDKY